MVTSFESLNICSEAIGLIKLVYSSIKDLKYFGLKNQIQRAAISIPSNIAESSERQTNKEFIQFLYIAIGCLFEVLTLTEIFKRRKLFKAKEAGKVRDKAKIIYRKTTALIKSLKRRT